MFVSKFSRSFYFAAVLAIVFGGSVAAKSEARAQKKVAKKAAALIDVAAKATALNAVTGKFAGQVKIDGKKKYVALTVTKDSSVEEVMAKLFKKVQALKRAGYRGYAMYKSVIVLYDAAGKKLGQFKVADFESVDAARDFVRTCLA